MKIQNALKEPISIAFGNGTEEADGFLHLEVGEEAELPDMNYYCIQKTLKH